MKIYTLPLAAILALPAIASAQLFTEHNLFVTGAMTANQSDIEGSLAVGGNLSLTNYSVGMGLPAWNGTSNTITVGASMTLTRTNIYRGNARSVGPANTNTVSVDGGGTVAGFTATTLNFASRDTYYTAVSTDLFTRPATGSYTNAAGTLTLNAAGNGLNVYTFSSSILPAITALTINGSSTATVVVNITGTSASIQNKSFALGGGITASRILFNFPTATTLTVSGVALSGSILAPNASMNFNNALINGQGAVQTFSGNGQWNSAPFTGTFTIQPCGGCSLADIAGGGPAGRSPDCIVDGSDFIAFINSFSTGNPTIDPLADVAGGGSDGLSPDGIIDGSDFIAFINAFAAGC